MIIDMEVGMILLGIAVLSSVSVIVIFKIRSNKSRPQRLEVLGFDKER